VLIGSGCSISYSVEQSSDSVAGSIDSISTSFDSFGSFSTSSGSGKKEVQAALLRFKDDIRALTLVFLQQEQQTDYFERQVGSIAKQYGLMDWEREPVTFMAIGSGLRQGGVTEPEISRISFLQSSVMIKNRRIIQEGFLEV